MKSLILILLSVVMWGACATEIGDSTDSNSPDDDSLMEVVGNLIGDGGVCRDSSGQPCFCGGASCNDGGTQSPGGGQGWGGGSNSYSCQNQIGCYTTMEQPYFRENIPFLCAVTGETAACGNPRAQVCAVWSAELAVVRCGTDICSTYPVPTFNGDILCGNIEGGSVNLYGYNRHCAGFNPAQSCAGPMPPPPPPPPPSSGGGGGGSTNPPCHGSGCTVEQSNPTQSQ